MVRDEPAAAAKAMAGDLGTDLAVGGVELEAALDRLEADHATVRSPAAAELENLEMAVHRAEAVLERTRAAASERLTSCLNTRLAIHPDTIRRAGAELLTAERAAEEAQAGAARRARRRRLFPLVAAGVGVVAGSGFGWSGSAVLGWSWAPAVGALIAVVAVASALGAWVRARRAPEVQVPAPLCAAVALTRRRWVQVAGADADPADVEAVIHRYDPQDPAVTPLVRQHPAVRAATRVVAERRDAWVAAWRTTVADHSETLRPSESDLFRQQKVELCLSDRTGHQVQPPALVVALPYTDLPNERARQLHRRLHDLPPGQQVVVILGPEPAIDLTSPAAHPAHVPERQPDDTAWAPS